MAVFDARHDLRIRRQALEWIEWQKALHDEVLPRSLLERGFECDGEYVRMIGPQGIFKPRQLQVPISITTIPGGPYPDTIGPNGLLLYRYRGLDPEHPDNRGLRLACERQLALAYFYRLSPGSYFAYSPVFIADDNRAALTFAVAMDDPRTAAETFGLEASHAAEDEATGRRRYITQVVLRRLHQRSFRERVLDAYRRMCAFCRLRHEELLDAAHIIGDTDPLGEPRVTNGLALCKLHHAAFDRHFIGLRPDYCLDVRPDLRKETDGPTLVHAIQGLHGKQIHLPRHDVEYPLPALVRLRFAAYERASVEAMSTTTP